MTVVESLRRESELAHGEMLEALDGVTERQAWSVLQQGGPDYLHSDGSIHGIALHVATAKMMYASAAFRETEVRWRDLAERVASFEPSWSAAMEYLAEAQEYWLSSWTPLTDSELDGEVKHPQGAMWPAWKIVRMMVHHDSYHAGQVAMLRYAVGESEAHPPSVAEDIRKYCADSVSW